MNPASAPPFADANARVGGCSLASARAGIERGRVAKLSDYRPVPAKGHMPFPGFVNCRETRIAEMRAARVEAYKRMIEEL